MVDAKTKEIRAEDNQVYSKLEDIADELPDSSPRFILLSYPHTLVSFFFPWVFSIYVPVLMSRRNSPPDDSPCHMCSSTICPKTATLRRAWCMPVPSSWCATQPRCSVWLRLRAKTTCLVLRKGWAARTDTDGTGFLFYIGIWNWKNRILLGPGFFWCWYNMLQSCYVVWWLYCEIAVAINDYTLASWRIYDEHWLDVVMSSSLTRWRAISWH